MSSVEVIENRMNQTKNILHKCTLEGKINIGLMLSDIDYLLYEIKKLEKELKHKNELIKQADKDLEREYVHKNKIKEKIEEINKRENVGIADIFEDMKEYAIQVLQELLKEGEEKCLK